jgi:hypothetical protein
LLCTAVSRAGLPVLGNFIELLRRGLVKFHIVIDEWAEQYGDAYKANIGSPGVILSDFAVAKVRTRCP